jgi:multidrug efflux pump
LPLITAGGAGAVSRFQMGMVIAAGLSIGTLFTLFVVPAAYMLLATDRSKKKVFVAAAAAPPAAPAE